MIGLIVNPYSAAHAQVLRVHSLLHPLGLRTMDVLCRRLSSHSIRVSEEETGNFTRRHSDSWDNDELLTLPKDLRPMKDETLDLILRQKVYLLQSRRGYRANVDSHVLAYFAAEVYRMGKEDRGTASYLRVLDLGAGNGLVSILFAKSYHPSNTCVHMLELQPQLANRARRNMALNDVQGDVTQYDLQGGSLPKHLHASFDIVLINPPFYPQGSRTPPRRKERLLAHMETSASIFDFLHAAYTACDPQNPDAFVAVIHDKREVPRLAQAALSNGFAWCESREMVHTAGEAPSRIMVQLRPKRKRQMHRSNLMLGMRGVGNEQNATMWEACIPSLPALVLHPSLAEQNVYTPEIEEFLGRLPLPSLRIGRLRDVLD